MRYYRRGDMHLEPNPEREEHNERIRELVDELQGEEGLAVSLMFFGAGSPTIESVAAEMGVSKYKAKGFINRGLESLYEALQEEDGVGALLAADRPRVRDVLDALQVAGTGHDEPGPVLPREDREGVDGADLGLDV